MSVSLLPKDALYPIVAKKCDSAIRREAQIIEHTAEMYLAHVRATSEWEKLSPPTVARQQASGVTDIGMTGVPGEGYSVKDYIVWMEGGDDDRGAMAIEMGHSPSGYFAGTATRSPRGLFILHRAAGLTFFRRFRR